MFPRDYYSNYKLFPALIFVLASLMSPASADPPALLLANVYNGHGDLDDYWVSEKLDGVRAYWDGKQLISRQGNAFSAPHWFIKDFPAVPLDGELWIGRGRFEAVSGTVRQLSPSASEWGSVKFMVFDLPVPELTFDERLARLQNLLKKINVPHLQAVRQFKVADPTELTSVLEQVVREGGEGLMLHRGDSLYRAGRSNDLLKVKTYEDAEAKVVRHLPGKGKYTGMMGALLVEMTDGLRFRIGTGFTDAQRADPPPIGTLITFKYFGLTKNKVPRFASFLRVRSDLNDMPTTDSAE